MSRKKGYGQFCPVAKAAEIVAERWTPLVLRELLLGSRRFNDLRRGLPTMSQSMLAQRLRELEWAGIVERREGDGGHGPAYHLTPAGKELWPVVEQLGVWGYRWAQREIGPDELDAGLLMWDIHRRIDTDALPPGRTVVHFRLCDAPGAKARWWLLLDRGEVDLCLKPPGFEVDVTVETDVRTLTLVWLGDLPFERAAADGALRLEGRRELCGRFPQWLALSGFAGTPLHELSVRPRPEARGVAGD